MAITHVSSHEDADGGTTVSVTLGPTQADDIIVFEVAHRGNTVNSIGGTFSPTVTEKHNQEFNSGNWEGYLFWARCTGDHDGETITFGNNLSSASSAIANIYRGAVASGDPLADATVVGEANASGDETQAQITTSTDGAMVCLTVANGGFVVSNQAATDPSSLTERIDSSGDNTRIAHASAEKATAGATGAFTWDHFDAVGGSWAYAIEPAAGDVTAPTLSSPSGTATGETTADLSVDTDEGNGTLYWVVTESGTAPSVAQIQAGQDDSGSAAADSGNQAVSATGTQNANATGLSAGTTYFAHFQHQDAAANDSTVVTSATFTTDSAGGASLTDSPLIRSPLTHSRLIR